MYHGEIFLFVHPITFSRSARNATSVLRKMVVVITCSVTTVNMTSVGCAWAIGKRMALNITSVHDTRKTLT